MKSCQALFAACACACACVVLPLHAVDRPRPGTGLHGDGYSWQQGASHVAECLATGKQPEVSTEHALHVIEIINAARESQRMGKRIAIQSRFTLPVVEGP